MSTVALIEFEQPASSLIRGAAQRTAVAQAMATRPGEWVLLGQWNNPGALRQMAYCLRNGLPGRQMFGPRFEAESMTMLGEHRLYARYVGGRS
ncbi:hypothetical protein ABZ172_04875 [Streptomyces sp. NPDC006296]|uniref:hypothetical protein n=1 Tax=Streptomyces sp. NPDC006296 TaxID=3156746 RepID=UPI0033A943E4